MTILKECRLCKETKSKDEFNRDRSRKDGLSSICRACCVITRKSPAIQEYNRERAKKRSQDAKFKSYWPRYNASRRGIARNLRHEHGLDQETSLYWADVLLHPFSRCAICGIPNKMIKAYFQSGWPWFFGRRRGAGSKTHLTLDHITPGRAEGGFRPLCSACNSTRGAEQFTDAEVLQSFRDKWIWFSGLRFLWWLNTTPGEGGRLHRSVRCQKRDAKFVDGSHVVPPLPPSPTSTNSSSPPTSAPDAV